MFRLPKGWNEPAKQAMADFGIEKFAASYRTETDSTEINIQPKNISPSAVYSTNGLIEKTAVCKKCEACIKHCLAAKGEDDHEKSE